MARTKSKQKRKRFLIRLKWKMRKKKRKEMANLSPATGSTTPEEKPLGASSEEMRSEGEAEGGLSSTL